MSPEPFLILHKVRGEAAFDIAIRFQIGSEEGWIIPTSGHRAYPHWHMKLDDLYSSPDAGTLCIRELIGTDEVPSDLPDHYAANDAVHQERSPTGTKPRSAADLMELLK